MKNNIIFAAIIVVLLSITMASKKSANNHKSLTKKRSTMEAQVNKGLAMEDKDQFN